MTIIIQTKNNNKSNDIGITTGCRLEGPRTKSELDGSKQDHRDVTNIGSVDYVLKYTWSGFQDR